MEAQLTQPGSQSEGALIARFVTIISPFFTLFAGWLGGVVAKAVPGVNLDRGQIVAFMVAAAQAAGRDQRDGSVTCEVTAAQRGEPGADGRLRIHA